MSDQENSASGSRWEPTDQPETGETPAAAPAPAAAAAVEPAPRRRRTPAMIAGAAVAVLALGGLGGFVAGQATAGSGNHDGAVVDHAEQTSFDPGNGPGHGGRHHESGLAPDGHRGPQGIVPDAVEPQVSDGDDDEDGSNT